MRYHKAPLGGFQPWMWSFRGDLGLVRERWTQQPDHWTLFFFEHEGVMVVNNQPIPFGDGFVGFVSPGNKIEFPKIGAGTPHMALTFGLVARSETVVIPAVADLGEDRELRRREFHDADAWLSVSIMRGLAAAFNTLWSIAEPIGAWRKSDLIYDAEALIVGRLGQPIVISEVAEELGISHSHLLRLFREEHNCTIQQFIREKRAEVARHLIGSTSLSLKEIAQRTGMSDLQYFNKVVRGATGLSPRALRELAETRTRH